MVETERVWAQRPLTFPYVIDLLSFREIPVLLRAFRKLRHPPDPPDLVFYDGHGYAHPRRFGIACHLGVLLDCPTIGCAKSILVGTPEEPGPQAGSWAPLVDNGETIAAVLRTGEATKPVYISQGHRISLESAVKFTRRVIDGFRIPRPTPETDILLSRSNARWPKGAQREKRSYEEGDLGNKNGRRKARRRSTSRGGWGDYRKHSAGCSIR